MMMSRTLLAVFISILTAAASERAALAAQSEADCSQRGLWIDGRDGKNIPRDAHFSNLTKSGLVLLGETHDSAEHHRWQLHTIAALHSRSDNLVIGFEMFPRSAQPVLDAWINGDLTEKAFLTSVKWQKTWGYDPDLYMPLFDFARMHRIPMVALNVDRELVSRVGMKGWDAIPISEREGLSNPAKPTQNYERALAETFKTKMALMAHGRFEGMASMRKTSESAKSISIDNILERPEFRRFVAAQLTWDRAMAEGLAEAKNRYHDALVIGVMGSGHLSHFHGVPYQLKDLGVTQSSVLIPVEAEQACDLVGAEYADALFTIESPAKPEYKQTRLRLGVQLGVSEQAALVERILPGSVAQTANLLEGDRIIRAAGINIRNAQTLVDVVGRQAPGTWLPLTVERSGSTIELVARFPALPERGS